MKLNKFVTVCLIVAAAGILIGGIGFLCGGRVYGVSLNKGGIIVNSNHSVDGSGKIEYVDVDKEVDAFSNLDMDISFADAKLVESDHFGIKYHLKRDCTVIDEINGDTFSVEQKQPRGINNNYSFFSFGMSSSTGMNNEQEYIIVYVPEGTKFGKVSIKNEMGDITLDALQTDDLIIADEFGTVETKDIQAKTADFDIDSGDVAIKSIVAENLDIKNRFGNIEGKKVTAESMECELDSGDCNIEDLSGNKVKITSRFGSIDLGLRETVEAYSITAEAKFGEIQVNDEDMGNKYNNSASESGNSLTLNNESGDIDLYDAD